jgi:hypothetical protein
MKNPRLEVQHLKRVSRIKHQILTKYLPSWAIILGSAFDLLYYIDCFADQDNTNQTVNSSTGLQSSR